jgi:uncharacterized OB-fold protein
LTRQLPALDPDTEFFWKAGAQGRLQICRCQSCTRYIHPPLPRCPACGGGTAPAPVSGKARIASYTINEQPWQRGLAVPYVFAAVELVEQPELYVLTNIIACPAQTLRIGLDVEVTFEQQEEFYLPLFRPANG